MSSFLSMGFTPAGYNKGNKKESNLATEAWAARKKATIKQAERAQVLRDRWQKLYKPMEEGLANEVTAGYTPDYNAVRNIAMQDVDQSFAMSDAENNRNSARMGLTNSPEYSAEIKRLGDLDKTATKVFASNNASDMARDRADDLTARRGAQITALGQQRPYLASGEMFAGDTAIADMLDYDTLRQAGANAEFAGADTQMAAGSSWRDGGSVTNPMRNGLKKQSYADGGAVLRAPDTARLKNKHTEAYGRGETDKEFGPWLEENGYQLGDDNQARQKDTTVAHAKPRAPDTRPRTPDFLFQPREYQKKPRNYADGGLVEEAPVELESKDYVIPSDVVHKLGTEYFDAMVEGGGK